MTGESDNIRTFLRLLVDKVEFTPMELESAVRQLPVPDRDFQDNGISLAQAIEVCE